MKKYIVKMTTITLIFTLVIVLTSCSNTKEKIESLSNELTQSIEKGDIEEAGKKINELKELVDSNVLSEYKKKLENKGMDQITSTLMSGDKKSVTKQLERLKQYVNDPKKLDERYAKVKSDIEKLKKLEQEKNVTVLIKELDSIKSNETAIEKQKEELAKKLETKVSKDLIKKYNKAIEKADIKEAATICAVLSNLENKTKEVDEVLSNFSEMKASINSIIKEHSTVVKNLQEVMKPPRWNRDNLIQDAKSDATLARWMSLKDYYDLLGPTITKEYKDAIIQEYHKGVLENDYIYLFPAGAGGPSHKKAICEEGYDIKIIDKNRIDITNKTTYYDPKGSPLYDERSERKETIDGVETSILEEYETVNYELIDRKWMCKNSSVNGASKVFTIDYQYTTSENLENFKKTLDIANDKKLNYKTYYSSQMKKEKLGDIPERFVFASGAGGWRTYIDISPDGTFTGEYAGTTDNANISCPFKGAFKEIKKINDYEYSMKIDYVKATGTEGDIQKDGQTIKIINATPRGFEDADDFILYLPGRKTEDLDEEFLNWVSLQHTWSSIPAKLPVYGLYNVKGKTGFSAMDE